MLKRLFSRKKNKNEVDAGENKHTNSEKSPSPNNVDTSVAILEKPEEKPLPPVGITDLFR